ncbi:MAG: helix-turn-helix transcriptional regulator [Bacillota bacterium]|nr:helix-turn-helix transcriptional regulator [Bacillota bacterium]
MNRISLGERLHELIKEKGLEQREIATMLGIKKSTFNGYANNTREPNINTLKIIANFFNVTVDYLIGFSDERNPNLDHLSAELNSFARNPENVRFIELANDIKIKTQKKII